MRSRFWLIIKPPQSSIGGSLQLGSYVGRLKPKGLQFKGGDSDERIVVGSL